MPLTPGTRLGPYEIVSPIGAGGMGEVYRARDTRLGRMVAVKVLTDPSNSRMQQEARAIAALHHPHICQIFDIGADYFVMEYLEGHPLKGPLPLAEALRLSSQIAWALEDAHAKGILHRDLKPANVLVDQHGMAKLLDFGLARISPDAGIDVTQTTDGVVMGTVPYMSPEQARGKPLDGRSDMFSFGSVFYELLTGERAFPGHTGAEVLSAVLRDDPPAPNVPSAVREIVMRCLRKDPAERYASMSEVKAALDAAARGEPSFADLPTQPIKVMASAAPDKQSIAVLPFINMSGDPEQAFFSDGLAEEIINALAGLAALRVIGRASSFRFRDEQDTPHVADALKVETVLGGSVRRAGKRVRITAQLNKADGSLLWSERFDRELDDIFAIQDEISAAVVEKLKVHLSGGVRAAAARKPSLAAYDSYLKGWYHLHRASPTDLQKSLDYFRAAVDEDPQYISAYVGLAAAMFMFATTGLRPAREFHVEAGNYLNKALDLDRDSVEVRALLGMLRGLYNFDWEGCRAEVERALATGQLSEWTRLSYVRWILWPSGKIDEAERVFAQVREADPLNPAFKRIAGDLAFVKGDFAKALELYRAATLADSTYWLGHVMMGWCEICLKRPDQAAAYFQEGERLQPHHPFVLCARACLDAVNGKTEEARAIFSGLMMRRQSGYFSGYLVALVAHFLGDYDRMFEYANQALEERDPLVFWFTSGAWFAHLRSDSRFRALRAKANLPPM